MAPADEERKDAFVWVPALRLSSICSVATLLSFNELSIPPAPSAGLWG